MKDIEEEYLLKNLKINSAFHIGAHKGEELDFYVQMGVKNLIFAEPNPELYEKVEKKCLQSQYKDMNLIVTDYAIYNVDGEILDFYLYYDEHKDNMGCSSLFESELHNKIYPQILYNGTMQVNTITADTLSKSDIVNFDIEFLNIDVQGAEYEVFLGAHNLLSTTVKAILVEVADVELYKSQKSKKEVTELLNKYGFVLDQYFPHADIWGDAYFIKK